MSSLIRQSRFGLSVCLWVFLLLANTVLFMSVWMRGGGSGGVQPALSATVNQQTGLGKIKWDSQWSVVTGIQPELGEIFTRGGRGGQTVLEDGWEAELLPPLLQTSDGAWLVPGWTLAQCSAGENKMIYYFSPRAELGWAGLTNYYGDNGLHLDITSHHSPA